MALLTKTDSTHKIKNRVRNDFQVTKIIVTILFALYSLSLLIFVFWALIMSFKSRPDYLKNCVSFPTKWMFSNYAKAFVELSTGKNNMFIMLLNTLWYCCGATFIMMAVSTVTGYVMAKYYFFLGRLLYWLCIITMIIPIVNSLPSQFMLAKVLNTYDSPLTLITSASGVNFNTLLLFSFFRSVDQGYAEAAFIDGASHCTIFCKIMLPLAISPIGALALTIFTGLWNDSEGPLVFLPSYPTLASGLYIYQYEASRQLNYPVMYAGLLMSAIPILVLWIIFNKQLLSLQFGGGIKG